MLADFPKNVFDLLTQQLASTGRIGATRLYLTPDVPSPAAAGGVSTPATIRFNEDGIVLAMYGQETDTATAALFAQTAVRCQIGGTQDLFVDGQGGPAFAPMLALFGGVNNWFPLMRRVTRGSLWTFTFQNNTAAGLIDPKIILAMISDEDVQKQLERR